MGGGFYDGDKGKAFYGVGSVSRMKNVSLRRKSADTQARAAIAGVFKTHIENLVKIYQREISDIDTSVSETFAQEATRGFTSMDMSGVQIVDRYYSETEQTQYSLAVFGLVAFKNQIEKMEMPSDRFREIILKNAEIAFKELDKLKK